jgi:hypothetical protein
MRASGIADSENPNDDVHLQNCGELRRGSLNLREASNRHPPTRNCFPVLAYHIDSARRLVTVTGEPATAPDWRALFEQLRSDRAFQTGLALLREVRRPAHHVDAGTIHNLIVVLREMCHVLELRRIAIVTPRNRGEKAVMLQAMAEDQGVPLRAFTFIEDALSWLDVGR